MKALSINLLPIFQPSARNSSGKIQQMKRKPRCRRRVVAVGDPRIPHRGAHPISDSYVFTQATNLRAEARFLPAHTRTLGA